MKKFLSILRRPLRVQYRLTVLYKGDTKARNHYSIDGRTLRRMAHSMEGLCIYWSLYKSGPFGLPEHEVDSYMMGDR